MEGDKYLGKEAGCKREEYIWDMSDLVIFYSNDELAKLCILALFITNVLYLWRTSMVFVSKVAGIPVEAEAADSLLCTRKSLLLSFPFAFLLLETSEAELHSPAT